MPRLSHLDDAGAAQMVDIGDKSASARIAVAEATVVMDPSTLRLIIEGGLAKGDVLAVARVAGIQAAKQCSQLIPLCHPLALTKVTVSFLERPPDRLLVRTECRVTGPTGVEMEALTGSAIAALTVYDMCKAVDRGMTVERLGLVHKSGGKSGAWDRAGST